MPNQKEAREAILNYRYAGLRASRMILKYNAGHNPQADWLATGGTLTAPDENHFQLLIIHEKHLISGEERDLIQGYRK